jgi:hypothetical protein
LNGLAVSFASKHLKFLAPEKAVVLDSIVSKRLGYELTPDGYQAFLNDCRRIRDRSISCGLDPRLGSGGMACQRYRNGNLRKIEGRVKFKEDRPFTTPEAAERKLLELANAVEADHAGRLSVEIINRQFREAGGSYEEYGAAVKAAIAHGWITMHPSGAYLSFTQAGAELFA